MNQTALKYGAAPFASVNLIPKEIAERKKMRAVRLMAGLALVVAAGVVVLGYLSVLGIKAVAQSDLDDAEQAQLTSLGARDAMVPVYYDYLAREQQEFALAQAGWGEVTYADLATAVANTATSPASSFDSITFTGPSALGIGGALGDQLFGYGVGILDFEARASSAAEASQLISRIEAVPGIAGVRAQSESFGDDSGTVHWKISGTAVMGYNTLTKRFIAEDDLTGINILGFATAASGGDANAVPSEEPTPSPEPTAGSEG